MWTTDVTEGGLPGYIGCVEREEMNFGVVQLVVETWPEYRIGSSHWPSGRLLAKALSDPAVSDFFPVVAGRHIAELGAGSDWEGLCLALPANLVVSLRWVDVCL